jgi:hypothetical protein
MATKRPVPEDPPTETEEERHAAEVAARAQARRLRQHSFNNPLVYDVSACPPCGPPGGYVITSRPAAGHTIRQADTPDETEET